MWAKFCELKMISTRNTIVAMIFTTGFAFTCMNMNISLTMVAMVEPTRDEEGKITEPECSARNQAFNNTNLVQEDFFAAPPDYGPRYEWDSRIQGLILGSYTWGRLVMCIPGGFLGEKFGPHKVMMVAFSVGVILAFLTPIAASWNYIALVALRFVQGLAGGLHFSNFFYLITRWAPPQERGKFTAACLGHLSGYIIMWPVLGAITEHFGWPCAFYFSGCVAAVCGLLWAFLVSDSPETHSRIKEAEKAYITDSLKDVIRATTTSPPYKKIITSLPVWAIIFAEFSNGWGFTLLSTWNPIFYSTVLGFKLQNVGILASLPHLVRLVCSQIFGFVSDFIMKRNIISVKATRKGFVLFSHFLPGALFLALNVTGCDVTWTIVLQTIALGFNSAIIVTSLQNMQDCAPNYACSTTGLVHFFTYFDGLIQPLLVGYLTAQNNGLDQWHLIFNIAGAIYMVGGSLFCIFCSTEQQKWDQDGGTNMAGR